MAGNRTAVNYGSAVDECDIMDFTEAESSRTVSETTSSTDHQYMPSVIFQRMQNRLRPTNPAVRVWPKWTVIAAISVGLLRLVYLGYAYFSGPAAGKIRV